MRCMCIGRIVLVMALTGLTGLVLTHRLDPECFASQVPPEEGIINLSISNVHLKSAGDDLYDVQFEIGLGVRDEFPGVSTEVVLVVEGVTVARLPIELEAIALAGLHDCWKQKATECYKGKCGSLGGIQGVCMRRDIWPFPPFCFCYYPILTSTFSGASILRGVMYEVIVDPRNELHEFDEGDNTYKSEIKRAPSLSQWSLIALGTLLAGSLAWEIHRKVAHRPAER